MTTETTKTLADAEIDAATPDELRAAYQSLREHHIAETTSLISRRDDLTRRRDAQFSKNMEHLAKAATLICRDEEVIARLVSENTCLSETIAKIFASRAAGPQESMATDCLSDVELTAWAERAGINRPSMAGLYLRLIVDELHERRDAEAIFVEVDRRFQATDCRTCDDQGADNCEDHQLLVRHWRSARAALCDLARLHRGYLRNLKITTDKHV
jgi:hypothetical protein